MWRGKGSGKSGSGRKRGREREREEEATIYSPFTYLQCVYLLGSLSLSLSLSLSHCWTVVWLERNCAAASTLSIEFKFMAHSCPCSSIRGRCSIERKKKSEWKRNEKASEREEGGGMDIMAREPEQSKEDSKYRYL